MKVPAVSGALPGQTVLVHEVTRADGEVAVVEDLVGAVEHLREPAVLWAVLLQPAIQDSLHGGLIGVERKEVEPSSKGHVHESYGPVRCVHSADDPEILGQ